MSGIILSVAISAAVVLAAARYPIFIVFCIAFGLITVLARAVAPG